MTQTKVYCCINGKDYKNWTLIADLREFTPLYVVDKKYNEFVHSLFPIDENIIPPKQSSLFICPNCPLAEMDIRRNYFIKRDVDSGDYNVFIPMKSVFNHARIFIYKTVLIYPDKQTIVAFANPKTKSEAELIATNYNLIGDYLYYSSGSLYDYILKLYLNDDAKGLYRDLFLENATYKKPWINYTQLNISSDLPVTLDILRLVCKAGEAKYTGLKSKDNFLLQLNVLNNYNWRAYPYTMQILRSRFRAHYDNVATIVHMEISKYPKVIKNFFSQPLAKTITKEDFQLAQTFIMDLYNLQGTSFVDFYKFQNKLLDDCVLSLINPLLSTIVKVKPLTFEEYERQNQSNN